MAARAEIDRDGTKARHLTDYECSSPASKMTLLPSILAGAGVISVLVDICENPGQPKTYYSGNNKARFNAVDRLRTAGLIAQQPDPVAQGRFTYRPTDEGRSVYIGLWYAANGGGLLPRMQERGIPVPPAFWSLDSVYTLSEADEKGHYFLVDTTAEDADHDVAIYDVFIDPGENMWFSIDGLKGRYCLDIDDSLDLDSPHAKDCFKRIVEDSKERQAKMSAIAYNDLLSFTEE